MIHLLSLRTRIICAAILTAILCSISNLSAQGFLKAEGTKIVNEKGENILLRGFGLGGWMLQEGYMLRVPGEGQQHKIRARIEDLIGPGKTQQFYDQWLANHTRKIDVDSMKAWGFNSVRLPMHYNLYTLPIEEENGDTNTWIEKGFVMTDQLLEWCKQNQMYLILDLHAAPGGQGTDANISDRDPDKPSLWDSEANQKKTVALWRKLAERYKDEPWLGGYDVINEPNWGFEDYANDKNGLNETQNGPLKKLMVEITQAIREVDRNHIIIIEGNGWGNNYRGMLPPWDDNMVLSFHKYWNYNDVNSIKHILETREKYNVPVWLGETGENSNVWFTQAIALLEDHNIGWAWWPLKKLGNNNPLEVPINPGYEAILQYWAAKAPKPSAEAAEKALFKLAEDLKLENNIFHKDVIDAMMRQPRSKETLPFKKHMVKGKTTIKAVDYDMGRNGFAYYDTDSANYYVSNGPRGGNRGRTYRNDGVDIERDSLDQNTYVINHITPGEWWQYTIDVQKSGTYRLEYLVSSENSGGKISFSVDGTNYDLTNIPSGKHRSDFKSVEGGRVVLKSGQNIVRIRAQEGGFNFKAFSLEPGKK